MSVKKINSTDTISAGFRSKYNESVDEIIISVTKLENGTIRFTKASGSYFDCELGFSGNNTGDETALSIMTKIGDGSQIDSQYLPAYVDDIIDLATVSETAPATPTEGLKYYKPSTKKIYTYTSGSWDAGVTPEQGKVYIAVDTIVQYRWSGSLLVDITNSLSFASQAEAEGNTENTKAMTALRVFQNWVNNVSNYDISTLSTTSKKLVGAINELYNNKVDKVTGKGLSTNDFDASAKSKVDNLPANTSQSLTGLDNRVTALETNMPQALTSTDDLAEGYTNKYFTEGRVKSTVLGEMVEDNNDLNALDTVFTAIRKIKSRLATLATAITTQVDAAITTIRGGVPSDGDTLKKLNDKINAIILGDRYKGTHVDLPALTAAYPNGQSGWEAVIDPGTGTDAKKAIWDANDSKWVIAGGGTITTDAVPTENSINAVQSGGTYAALANKVDKNGTDRLMTAAEGTKLAGISGNNTGDETKDTIETKLQASTLSTVAKTIVAAINELLSGKAAKVPTPTANRMVKTDADGNPQQCSFTEAQVVQLAAIDMTNVPEGGTKLLVATKEVGTGNTIFEGGADTIDTIAANLDTLLTDTASGWANDSITLTGDNRTGALGQTGQDYWLNGHRYLCTAHILGTTASNGSATWKRTIGNGALEATRDAALITAVTGATYNVDNAAVISTKSKPGSWYTSGSGYFYFCYAESGANYYWRRFGQPDGDVMQITDATLKAEIEAHDFATTPALNPAATEKGKQGQEHTWENPTGTWHVAQCKFVPAISALRWLKMK